MGKSSKKKPKGFFKRNRDQLYIELIGSGLVGGLIGFVLIIFSIFILPSYIPHADIEVTCSRQEPEDIHFSLLFENKADFAGEDFTLFLTPHNKSFIKNITWSPPRTELCNEVEPKYHDNESTSIKHYKIYCRYIPPRTKTGLYVPSEDNQKFYITYWAKNTKYETEQLTC